MKKWMIVSVLVVGICAWSTAQMNNRITSATTVSNTERYGNGNLVYLVEGDNMMTRGQFERSILAYDNAIAADPYLAEAYVKRAIAKYRLGRISEAEQDFKQANELNPYAADLYSQKTDMRRLRVLAFEPYEWLTEFHLENQMDYYKTYYVNREIPAEIERVISLIRMKEYDNALQLIDDQISYHRSYEVMLHDLKGLVYSKINRWDDAILAHRTAIEQDRNFALAYYNLSVAERHLGNNMAALDHVSESIRLQPDFNEAYFQRAILYRLTNDYESALEDYYTLNKRIPAESLAIRFNRAVTKQLSGDAVGALQDLNHLIERGQNENALLYKLRGNTFMLLGRFQQAANDYTRAIRLDEDFAEAYFNRGMARLMLYNRPDGCFDLEQGIDLGYEEGAERFQLFCGF